MTAPSPEARADADPPPAERPRAAGTAHRHARAWPPLPGEIQPSGSKILWLHLHLVPLLSLGSSVVDLPVMLCSALFCAICLCLGHSVGLHRGLIHRSFSMGRGARFVLVLLATLTGIGPPLRLMDLHDLRDAWQNQREAPAYYAYQHGVLRDLWWNLHCAHHPQVGQPAIPMRTRGRYAGAPELAALDRWWWLINLAASAIAYRIAGLPGLIWAGAGRVSTSILGHWLVNYCAHRHGELRWEIEGAGEEGRNNLLFGALSMGEGWHNNHHAFPHSARFGQRWWELDAGWAAIRLLRGIGLVYGVIEDRGEGEPSRAGADPTRSVRRRGA